MRALRVRASTFGVAGTLSGFCRNSQSGQAAANERQVVVSCAVTQDANDVGQDQPMVAKTAETLGAVGGTEPIGLVLSDAGYWSEENATAEGPDRLIVTLEDWRQRRAAREMGTTTGPPPKMRRRSRPWTTGCAPPRARPPTPRVHTPSSRCSEITEITRRTAAGTAFDAGASTRR